MSFFKIIRPLNLFITFITLSLFWFVILIPTLSPFQVETLLSPTLFLCFNMVCILFMAGGYVINDIFDIETDRINKVEKMYVTSTIKKDIAWNYYLLLNGLSVGLALYLLYFTHSWIIVACCIFNILLYYWYSKKLKSTVLVGNVMVALVIACAPLILIAVEYEAIYSLSGVDANAFSILMTIFLSFSVFAFLINFSREVVKDCEDHDGDKRSQVNTLAVSRGLKHAEKWSLSTLALIFPGLIFWFVKFDIVNNMLDMTVFILLLVFPLSLIIGIMSKKTKIRSDYKKISTYQKIYMGLGLIYLFIHIIIVNA